MKAKAFTLIEVLLSTSLLIAFVAISVPIYSTLKTRNDLVSITNQSVSAIRTAQANAQGIKGDDNWGLNFSAGQITVFKGNSFASRDSDYDQLYKITSNINFSGQTETIFTKFTGEPTSPGTVTLTNSNGDTANITINSKGSIEY